MNNILIAAAVHEEAEMIIRQIKNPVVSQVGRRKIISGCLEGISVSVIITGPGIVNTVQALTAVIENAIPSLIIQTGCAGAFKASGLGIGDIGIATEEIDVHLGIEPDSLPTSHFSLPDPLPFPLIKQGNLELKNRYPLDHDLADSAFEIIRSVFDKKSQGAGRKGQVAGCKSYSGNSSTELTKASQQPTANSQQPAANSQQPIHIRTGPFATVSTITATDNRAEILYHQFGACMESMEGSGAAHLAIHYEIPFLEIRAASNFVGKRERDLWNLPLAFERCGLAVLALIRNPSFQTGIQKSSGHLRQSEKCFHFINKSLLI